MASARVLIKALRNHLRFDRWGLSVPRQGLGFQSSGFKVQGSGCLFMV